MTTRRPLLAALSLGFLVSVPAVAQDPAIHVAEVGPDSARLVIELAEPATVAVNHGEAPFEWTALVESVTPSTRHELLLTKLAPDTRVFYQLFIDGIPQEGVYQLKAGRSWASRRASIMVTAERPHGSPDEEDAVRALLRGEPDVVLALGGSTAPREAFRALYERSLTERPVLTPATRDGETDLRVVPVSDVAIALLGDAPLTGDGAGALAWAKAALDAVEGACWRVGASARVLDAASLDAVAGAASAAGLHALVARGRAPALVEKGDLVVVLLADADEMKEPRRHHARLSFEAGAFDAALLGSDGSGIGHARRERVCPLPELEMPNLASADELGLDAGMDGEAALAEDCDY